MTNKQHMKLDFS